MLRGLWQIGIFSLFQLCTKYNWLFLDFRVWNPFSCKHTLRFVQNYVGKTFFLLTQFQRHIKSCFEHKTFLIIILVSLIWLWNPDLLQNNGIFCHSVMSFYHPLKVAPPPLIAFVTKTEVSKDNKKLAPLPCIAYVD